MNKINLLEILHKHIPTELYDPSLDKYYLSAMKEACEATVGLCIESVKCQDDGDYLILEVDKKSILKVKQLII